MLLLLMKIDKEECQTANTQKDALAIPLWVGASEYVQLAGYAHCFVKVCTVWVLW